MTNRSLDMSVKILYNVLRDADHCYLYYVVRAEGPKVCVNNIVTELRYVTDLCHGCKSVHKYCILLVCKSANTCTGQTGTYHWSNFTTMLQVHIA